MNYSFCQERGVKKQNLFPYRTLVFFECKGFLSGWNELKLFFLFIKVHKYIFFILPFAVLGILNNFALVLIPLRTRTKPMEWTVAHDVLLCREMLAINPFKAKRKTIQRTKMWETIVHHLEQIEEPSFKVSVRSIRDRYSLLAKKFRKCAPLVIP